MGSAEGGTDLRVLVEVVLDTLAAIASDDEPVVGPRRRQQRAVAPTLLDVLVHEAHRRQGVEQPLPRASHGGVS